MMADAGLVTVRRMIGRDWSWREGEGEMNPYFASGESGTDWSCTGGVGEGLGCVGFMGLGDMGVMGLDDMGVVLDDTGLTSLGDAGLRVLDNMRLTGLDDTGFIGLDDTDFDIT